MFLEYEDLHDVNPGWTQLRGHGHHHVAGARLTACGAWCSRRIRAARCESLMDIIGQVLGSATVCADRGSGADTREWLEVPRSPSDSMVVPIRARPIIPVRIADATDPDRQPRSAALPHTYCALH